MKPPSLQSSRRCWTLSVHVSPSNYSAQPLAYPRRAKRSEGPCAHAGGSQTLVKLRPIGTRCPPSTRPPLRHTDKRRPAHAFDQIVRDPTRSHELSDESNLVIPSAAAQPVRSMLCPEKRSQGTPSVAAISLQEWSPRSTSGLVLARLCRGHGRLTPPTSTAIWENAAAKQRLTDRSKPQVNK